VLDVTRVAELRRIERYPHHIAIGAAVPLADAFAALEAARPALHDFAARFAGTRAAIDHGGEALIDRKLEVILADGARETARDVKTLKRKNAAPFGIDQEQLIIIPRLGHRKDAAVIAGDEVVDPEAGHAR